MKHVKVLLFFLILFLAGTVLGFAMAAEDPIAGEIEITPDTLTSAGTVNVKITISNTSNQDLADPVYLYTPQGKLVDDFGNKGAVTLKAGESKTWNGKCSVNTRTLEDGKIVYYVMYTTYDDEGQSHTEKQPLSVAIKKGVANDGLVVNRVISPSIAKEGQEITIVYNISNKSETSLYNVTIKENKSINSKKSTIAELKSGKNADVTYTTTMGKKALTSSATITYCTEENGKSKTYTVPKQTIAIGEPKLSISFTSSADGVIENSTVKLTLTLKNTGTVGYSDIRVTDPVLGEVFSGAEVDAGKNLILEKEVTIPETMDFVFTIQAVDETGSDFSATTDKLTVTAVSENDVLKLDVNAVADQTLLYETPGRVRFTITITNSGNVDAKDAVLSHGSVTLSKLGDIKVGDTIKITRDTLISLSGRMRFTVTAIDPLGNTQEFQANDIQIVLTSPTQPPVTPTQPPAATPVPTVFQATIPPVEDPSIAPGAKLLHKISVPMMVVFGIISLGLIILLIIALAHRKADEKASEMALDHLERSERRDYSQESSNRPERSENRESIPSEPVPPDFYGDENIPDGYRASDYDQDTLPLSRYAQKPGLELNQTDPTDDIMKENASLKNESALEIPSESNGSEHRRGRKENGSSQNHL